VAHHDRVSEDGVERGGIAAALGTARQPIPVAERRSAWPTPSEPPSVRIGVRCGLITGTIWIMLSLLRLPGELWGPGHNHSGFWGVTALFGGVVILLSMATRRRSARAWLLLQLSNALITIVTVGAIVTLVSAYRDTEDDWMALLCILTGPLQLLAMVLLNQREARRWCRVDPDGYRNHRTLM
jgi:hypothetical protein